MRFPIVYSCIDTIDIDILDNRYRSMGSHIVYNCIGIIDIDLWDNRYTRGDPKITGI
jgi:hypothetical protein